jgi:hypothetical protein
MAAEKPMRGSRDQAAREGCAVAPMRLLRDFPDFDGRCPVGRFLRVTGFAARFAAMRLLDTDVDLIVLAMAVVPIEWTVQPPRQTGALPWTSLRPGTTGAA